MYISSMSDERWNIQLFMTVYDRAKYVYNINKQTN